MGISLRFNLGLLILAAPLGAQTTQKPPLHARHWIAITASRSPPRQAH
jgi:hypothetical protein